MDKTVSGDSGFPLSWVRSAMSASVVPLSLALTPAIIYLVGATAHRALLDRFGLSGFVTPPVDVMLERGALIGALALLLSALLAHALYLGFQRLAPKEADKSEDQLQLGRVVQLVLATVLAVMISSQAVGFGFGKLRVYLVKRDLAGECFDCFVYQTSAETFRGTPIASSGDLIAVARRDGVVSIVEWKSVCSVRKRIDPQIEVCPAADEPRVRPRPLS